MKTKSAISAAIFSALGGIVALSSWLFSQSPDKAEPGLVMTQHMFAGQAKTPNTITMSIKGAKFRTDNDTTTSSIIDTETGDMTTLMHDQKMAMTMNMKAIPAPPATPGAAPAKIPETKVTATGKMETIDGYECEIYTSENSGMVVKMWIAKKYPNYEKLKQALKPMEKMSAAGAPKAPEVPGMMLKSEYEQSGIKFVTKLVGITEKKLSDDLFKAPADYKAPAQ